MASAKIVHEAAMRRNSVIPAIPVSISDKAILVEEICLPSPRCRDKESTEDSKKGRTTWLLATIALPIIAVCLLVTLFLLADPYKLPSKTERLKSAPILRRNMFILDLNGVKYPNAAKVALLESFLTKNKNTELYQITLNRFLDQPRNITPFINLKKKYRNFHFLYQNIPSYFKGSMFESDLDPTNIKDLLLKAQLLVLWRYGGTVISRNWVPVQTFEKMSLKKDGSVLVGGYNGKLALIGVSNTCNAKLYDVMVELKVRNGSWINEMDIIDRVSTKSKGGFKRIEFPNICNNDTVNDECFLMKQNDYIWKNKIKPVQNITENVTQTTKKPDITLDGPSLVRHFYIVTQN